MYLYRLERPAAGFNRETSDWSGKEEEAVRCSSLQRIEWRVFFEFLRGRC